MKKYMNHIEETHFVAEVESSLTSGDLDYPGTALEIRELGGEELFHVVVTSNGEQQVLFYAQGQDYRLPLDLVAQILNTAKEKVTRTE